MKIKCLKNLFVIGMLSLTICYAGAAIIYVDGTATSGGNNGSSWADAYLYLQDAITNANAADQIWVAAGVYTPDKDTANPTGTGDRTATFTLKNLVEIHGGFVGGETSLEERETDVDGAYVNVVYLSGDLLGDDEPSTLVQDLLTDTTRAENSYHVITGTLCGPPTVLEGVTVTAGQADGADELGKGGGWYNITNSSPTVEKCIFTHNTASTRGGGWYNEGSSCKPALTSVIFMVNYCADRGGAIVMLNNVADVILDYCSLYSNYASSYAGAIYLDVSSPTISNSNFENNYATYGGALVGNGTCNIASANNTFTSNSAVNGGAVWMDSISLPLGDCFFNQNSANNGGAVYSNNSSPSITKCIFLNNTSTASGGAIYNRKGHPKLVHDIFIGNSSVSNGGAIVNVAIGYESHAYLTTWNCIFIGNNVTGNGANGGAISNHYGSGGVLGVRYTYTTHINTTFYNNVAVDRGGGIYTNSGSSTNTIKNSILFGNSAGGNYDETAQIYGGTNTVQYSCVQNLSSYAGNGNIGDDPLFDDPLGPDWIGGTLDDNLRLVVGSPCIDAGNNNLAPTELTEDLDGNPRILDGDNDSQAVVDMGAYEYDPGCIPYFADPELKSAVEVALGITDPNCDDMLNLTSLDISNEDITYLDGLEYATNLTYLKANNNLIVDLNPIASCTSLQTLYLYYNDIEDISPLCSLVNLTYLHLAYNEITEIPSCLCNLNQIRSLYLYGNPISDICPATCFTSLRTFWIYSIETLPLNNYQVCIPDIKDNNPNLTDFRYDYGCDPELEMDVNYDCIVNLIDFAQMCEEWLSCTHIYAEMCP